MGAPQFGEHQSFWDQAAKDAIWIAILDNEDVRDPARAIAAFRKEGEVDARRLSALVHPDATVVDLGCGVGRVLAPLARRCRRAIGVDVSEEMIARGRDYVGCDAPNLEFVHTDGRTLPGIADGSVDLLYALLVLIHVDRRSAWHYFGEVRRVLRPGRGIARLQFHDIESAPGLAKFIEIAPTAYPLEFYTEVELRRLLGAADLDVLDVEHHGSYVTLDVTPGSAEAWRREFEREVQIVEHGADGCLATTSDTALDLAKSGRRWLRLRAAPGSRRSVQAIAALGAIGTGPAHATHRVLATVPLTAGSEHLLAFVWHSDERRWSLLVDGDPVDDSQNVSEGPLPHDSAELHFGLMPPAHRWQQPTLERFPQWFESRRVRLRSRG